MSVSRFASYAVALVIVLYGTFGKMLWPFFQAAAEWFISNEQWISRLKSFFGGEEMASTDIYNLGRYLIYYPSYLLLHLVLINAIFWSTKYIKKANLFFIGALATLLIATLTFYALGFHYLYQMMMSITNSFLNLPIILFIVEGGRVLLKDIRKRTESIDQSE